MEGLKIHDQNFLKHFKYSLFEKKEEFVKGYYEKGKVVLCVDIPLEYLKLTDYIGSIVRKDFVDFLRDKFMYDDLERLRFDMRGFEGNQIFISLSKE